MQNRIFQSGDYTISIGEDYIYYDFKGWNINLINYSNGVTKERVKRHIPKPHIYKSDNLINFPVDVYSGKNVYSEDEFYMYKFSLPSDYSFEITEEMCEQIKNTIDESDLEECNEYDVKFREFVN